MHIEITKGKFQWHWRLVANNGEVIAISQRYCIKYNAKRAAVKLAGANGWEFRVA